MNPATLDPVYGTDAPEPIEDVLDRLGARGTLSVKQGPGAWYAWFLGGNPWDVVGIGPTRDAAVRRLAEAAGTAPASYTVTGEPEPAHYNLLRYPLEPIAPDADPYFVREITVRPGILEVGSVVTIVVQPAEVVPAPEPSGNEVADEILDEHGS